VRPAAVQYSQRGNCSHVEQGDAYMKICCYQNLYDYVSVTLTSFTNSIRILYKYGKVCVSQNTTSLVLYLFIYLFIYLF